MTSSNSPSTAPAMALMEKYSSMGRGIEEARRETAQIKKDMESKTTEIENLQQEHRDMSCQIQQAREESHQLSIDIGETMRHSSQMEQDLSKATSELARVQRQHDVVARFIQEERRAFLDTCRDFRTSLKRTRLEVSETENDETIMVRAFLEMHNVHDNDEEMEGRDDHDLAVTEEEASGSTFRAESNKNRTSDVEMEQALERNRHSLDRKQHASIALKQALAKKEATLERSKARGKQMEQQHGQLERIQKDITEMESQLTDLLRETRRAQEMGENLEKDAARRRQQASGTNHRFTPLSAPMSQHPVTPSPYASSSSLTQTKPHNPYANQKKTTAAPINRYSQSGSVDTNRTNAPSARNMERDNWNSSLERQHPHRAGRIRVDRQFSTALEIVSTREDESSETAGDHQNRDHPGQTETGDSPQDRAVGWSNSPMTATPKEYKTTLLDTLEEQDSDDDELLSYVVFSKSK